MSYDFWLMVNFPKVFNHCNVHDFYRNTLVKDVFPIIRDRLVKLGFRRIEETEKVFDSLLEADRFLEKREENNY